MKKMKQILFWAAIVLLFAACREKGEIISPEDTTIPEEVVLPIPEIEWTWEKPEDLRAINVYLGFEQDPSGVTKTELEDLWHNAGRIMIPYIGYKKNQYGNSIPSGIIKMLRCSRRPDSTQVEVERYAGLSNDEVALLIEKMQNDTNYCDFSELKKSMDYFLCKGRAVCVDVHEFIGYFLYTNPANEDELLKSARLKSYAVQDACRIERLVRHCLLYGNNQTNEYDESLFGDEQKKVLFKEFHLQLSRFLANNYQKQVKEGNVLLEILNEPKDERWESLQLRVARAISNKFPDLYLGIRPNQSYSVNCLRNTWFEPSDYASMKTVTFLNFWFMERPDLKASPLEFTIQYETFEDFREGKNVEFNIFGGTAASLYADAEYRITPELLEEEFSMTADDWASKNNTKVFFAELGCIRYADPEGQYFLYCLRYGQKYGIGIALFEVGAKYFFQYDGDVPFYLNDKNWAGFKYLQMDPGEIAFEEPLW